MFEWLLSPEALVALFTLTALEIVLGIDNIILISILVAKLPPKQRQPGRIIGLSLAMGTRILLLLTLSWMMHLTEPLFELFGKGVSGRDLILFFTNDNLNYNKKHSLFQDECLAFLIFYYLSSEIPNS